MIRSFRGIGMVLAVSTIFICTMGAAPGYSSTDPTTDPTSTTQPACAESPITPDSQAQPGLILSPAQTGLTLSPADCTPLNVSFSASPNSVGYGGSTTLNWSVSPYCPNGHISSSVWSSSVGSTGSQSVGPLTSSVTFNLHCDADATVDGGDWQASVNVGAPPPPPPPPPGGGTPPPTALSFTADAIQLSAGQHTTLHWACDSNTTNASITSSNPNFGTFSGLATSGQINTLNLPQGSYTENLNCSNSVGTDSHLSVNISVGAAAPPPPPPPVNPPQVTSFTTNTSGPWSGGSVQLNWSSANATSCGINSNPSSGGATSGQPVSGGWITPSLSAGQIQYTLTCSNSASSATATLYLGVFDTNEQAAGNAGTGQNTDPSAWRSLDFASRCRWKSETNENDLKTRIGLRAGGLSTKVDWCVRSGQIIKVVRTISVIGPNYPLSGWKFDGISSYGPCDEQCSNYVGLYGTNRTSINIWVQGHWSLCLSIPVIGSLCAQDTYEVVGVLIRGDGTRADTYGS